tara:strand:+ start:5943 stop:8627 length:2685 start_codon:yes stop_codon:yes gene_type:complete
LRKNADRLDKSTAATEKAVKAMEKAVSKKAIRKPRFAIVSAVFNASKYLSDFVNSVERQSIPNREIEIIMVDDGSKDDSLEILKGWAETSQKKVTVLTKENGGQASARNLGLRYVTADWVTFTDPDDWVNDDYLFEVSSFIDRHEEIDMIATNRILYIEKAGEFSDSHPTRKMFSKDQLVSLDGFPEFFAGSAPASFMRTEIINGLGLEFDERVRPNFEDGLFCAQYLLSKKSPKVGFLKSAEYFYRKRADESSTLATSMQHQGRFTNVPRYGYLAALREGAQKYGKPPEWLQNLILYELSWFFSGEDQPAGSATAAVGSVGADFLDSLRDISRYLDQNTIDGFSTRRYKETWKEVIRHGIFFHDWHTNYISVIQVDLDAKRMQIAYRFSGKMPKETIYFRGSTVDLEHPKVRSYKYFGESLLFERTGWVSTEGTLRIRLDERSVAVKFGWENTSVNTAFRPKAMRDKILALSDKAHRSVQRAHGVVRNCADSFLGFDLESQFAKFRVNLLSFIADSYFARRIYRNSWVLIDRIHDANDSAEVLFHYLRDERPEVNAWFVLERGTADWKRLKSRKTRKLIPHGSLRWLLLMRNCEKLISSHADVPIVNHPKTEGVLRRQPKFVFLQHGVIKDDISLWLNEKDIRLFVTSTPDEYRYISGDFSPFRFSSREVALTGLPRFDALERAKRHKSDDAKNLIIIAPTWRHWLLAPLEKGRQTRAAESGFVESDFLRNWLELLHRDCWTESSLFFEHEIAFLPHPNLADALHNSDIDIGVRLLRYDDPGLHNYFARASVFVTDFSSIAFNAAYLRCPVVYFQFDRQKVLSGGHVGREGYFDYYRDGFGPVTTHVDEAVSAISNIVVNNGASSPYRDRIEEAFPFRDGKCSERVTKEIESI